MWEGYRKGFKAWLQLEKSLSHNSVEAYLHDLDKFIQYLLMKGVDNSPKEILLPDLESFVEYLNILGMTSSSQARIIAGLKSFYRYCQVEQITLADPTALLEVPKLKRKLPDILSYTEIESILSKIETGTPEGTRNKAIIETLYSCGLRVSELINIKISCLYFEIGFIRVIGKGDKERLVPIGESAIKYIGLYKDFVRIHVPGL